MKVHAKKILVEFTTKAGKKIMIPAIQTFEMKDLEMDFDLMIERIEDLGRIHQILRHGIGQGMLSNTYVNTPEKFIDAWKDDLEGLYERIKIMEEALDDAYEICTKRVCED